MQIKARFVTSLAITFNKKVYYNIQYFIVGFQMKVSNGTSILELLLTEITDNLIFRNCTPLQRNAFCGS